MDGVLWRDDQPIGNLEEIFAQIEAKGLKFVLATNNATRSPTQYLEKLKRFGVSLALWQILTSPMAAVRYLKQKYKDGGPVYLIGEEGLLQEMDSQGFFQAERDVLAVVVGLDRHLTYEKLRKATLLIRQGAPFIATNLDRTLPDPAGFVPGAGSIVAALEAATEVRPLVMGKPETGLYQLALDRLGSQPGETLAVGDRLETDIAGAQKAGIRSALVLSGASSRSQAELWKPAPDTITDDLTSLVASL
jgi:4-nitrophenyl phosphatase